MNNLSKSILNYFATFTETKFSFRTLVNYRWTDTELTLPLSIYPEFEEDLLNDISKGKLVNKTIKLGDYRVFMPKKEIILSYKEILAEKCNQKLIDSSLKKAETDISKTSNSEDEKARQNLIMKNGLRLYNLKLREEVEKTVINLQEKRINELMEDYKISQRPKTTSSIPTLTQKYFDDFQKIASKCSSSDKYLSDIEKYLSESVEDLTLFDLFFSIQNYLPFQRSGTMYLFFHSLVKADNKTESFPLYFIEVNIQSIDNQIELSFPRNLVLINVPAINYHQFESILTVPRATNSSDAVSYLRQVEGFFQHNYGIESPFIFERNFSTIIAEDEKLPQIFYKVGLQVVQNENKRILDYSELLTVGDGPSGKFGKFLDDYINGNVENTRDIIDKQFKDRFPAKSPSRYMAESPIPLNKSQKNILLALEHPKNKIVVVDGPPGTGKSYTISAITYWANKNNKSVVVSSHKKEAIDVIEGLLTTSFKKLHPNAKPSIVRIGDDDAANNKPEISFSAAVVSAAADRNSDFNIEAAEQDLKNIKVRLENALSNRINQSSDYKELIEKMVAYEKKCESLVNKDFINSLPAILDQDKKIDIDQLELFVSEHDLTLFKNISLEQLQYLVDRQGKIKATLDACEKIENLPIELLHFQPTAKNLSKIFIEDATIIVNSFEKNLLLNKLTMKDAKTSMFRQVIGRAKSKEDIEISLKECMGLKASDSIGDIAKLYNKSREDLTVDDLRFGIEKITNFYKYKVEISRVAEFMSESRLNNIAIPDFYKLLKYVLELAGDHNKEFETVISIFTLFKNELRQLSVFSEDVSTLERLKQLGGVEKNYWEVIKLHVQVAIPRTSAKMRDLFEQYYSLEQKIIENKNDERLKQTNQEQGDISRMKIMIDQGKRLDAEQLRIMLKNIACVLASPETISRYFPMQEDVIDLLILDEASQVSIAESISLILRAKQVVIFGDELQYGAVSAVNVSSKYQECYFRDVVDSFSKDFKRNISEEEKNRLVSEVGTNDDDYVIEQFTTPQKETTVEWLKTFNIRTSTLSFCKAIANYNTSLREHFRSFREIIDYSNDFFYKPCQIELTVNRIRTKPIGEVLRFIKVETKGKAEANVNLDEIDVIRKDIEEYIKNGFKGTFGIIASFREQAKRIEDNFQKELTNYRTLSKNNKLKIWFVGDVQGEERDVIYYSLVQDKKIDNADLRTIYPVIGGAADTIRSLKMQRLNVGFSRAKDTMVFVHSMPIEDYSDTRLGDAVKHYRKLLEEAKENDFVVDEEVFDSPMEKMLYGLLLQTDFVKNNHKNIRIIPQFNIGAYLQAEYKKYLPKYRADFLVTLSNGGKEQTLILEYDGIEYHYKNPEEVNANNFSQEYIDYDINRQLELESYGYRFLRINKFNLLPTEPGQNKVSVLNKMLEVNFS